jgi:hypothetical protein
VSKSTKSTTSVAFLLTNKGSHGRRGVFSFTFREKPLVCSRSVTRVRKRINRTATANTIRARKSKSARCVHAVEAENSRKWQRRRRNAKLAIDDGQVPEMVGKETGDGG